MQFRYRTILFEFQKDGILGDRFIDGDRVEEKLNRMGQAGWELVSVANVRDGLLAILKKTFGHAGTRTTPTASRCPTSISGPETTREKTPAQQPLGPTRSIGEIKIE